MDGKPPCPIGPGTADERRDKSPWAGLVLVHVTTHKAKRAGSWMIYLTSEESFHELIKTVGVIPPERRLAMNVWCPIAIVPITVICS